MKTLIFLAIIGFFAYNSNPTTSDFVDYLQHQSRNQLIHSGANASFSNYITDSAFSFFKGSISKAVVREDLGILSFYVIDIPFTDNDPVYIGFLGTFNRLDKGN